MPSKVNKPRTYMWWQHSTSQMEGNYYVKLLIRRNTKDNIGYKFYFYYLQLINCFLNEYGKLPTVDSELDLESISIALDINDDELLNTLISELKKCNLIEFVDVNKHWYISNIPMLIGNNSANRISTKKKPSRYRNQEDINTNDNPDEELENLETSSEEITRIVNTPWVNTRNS